MNKVSNSTFKKLMSKSQDIVSPHIRRMKDVIEELAQKEYDKGIRGRYYIHSWVRQHPEEKNEFIRFTQCRLSRPSPYQDYDHALWLIDENQICHFEWSIPNKQELRYMLANPERYDPSSIKMLRRYCEDKLEKIEDYLVNDKLI
jgi:hypothetical protein